MPTCAGDGRPDYAYNGWVLYADTVSPTRLPASGGPITIRGHGLSPGRHGTGGRASGPVTSISPNQITAIAPPAATGVTGSVDVEVDDLPDFYAAAVIPGGVSYDSGNGDALTLIPRPSNTVPIGVPLPFTVTALGSDLTPAGGVTVIYTVTSGTATLACGLPVCSVVATGDGRATMNVTATSKTWSTVTASLTNGSSLQAQFVGGTPPVLSALTPQLSLAAGATFTWTVQALVAEQRRSRERPDRDWQNPTAGIAAQARLRSLTNSAGIATQTLTVGPLAEGQTASINACLNGTSQCVAFTAFGARPEYAALEAISGTSQSLAASGTAEPDRAAPSRHGRQPHGRRHGGALPGALRVDAALLAQRGLPARSAAGHASLDGHLCCRWLGHVCARVPARRGDESDGPRRLGKYLDGEHFD